MSLAPSTKRAAAAVREATWRERPCPACFGDAVVDISTQVCDAATRDGAFRFVKRDSICGECGLLFAHAVPDDGFLNDYYAAGYLHLKADRAGHLGFDSEWRLAQLRQSVPTGARVVEFGAGDGAFVEALNGAGWRASGVDLVRKEASDGVERRAVESAEMRGADAVVSYYVLEHVADPRRFLAACKAALKPGGTLVIEVPDVDRFPDEALHHEHLTYFAPATLRSLVEAVGFGTIRHHERASRYFGHSLVATLEDTARDRPVAPLPQGIRAAAVDKARRLAAQAAEAGQARRRSAERLVAKIVREHGDPAAFDLVVWGANLMATEIGLAAAAAGVERRTLVDRSESKIGDVHEGYATATQRPDFAGDARRPRAIVICSQAWRESIRAELAAMGPQNARVYAAFDES